MNLPADLPEYVSRALDELEVKASDMLRKGANSDRAAGYYSAIADFREQMEVEAKMEAADRIKRLRAITHGSGDAA